jgi:arylsulfatase A-like enzyme
MLDNTIVVLTADHGEGLGDRGTVWPNGDHWLHGDDVYEPGTRMPLIIHDPRWQGARPVPQVPVQSVDVMPTILDLLGLPTPAHAQGKSLAPILDGSDSGADRIAVVTLTDDSHTAIIAADGWKLVMARQTGARELYFLPDDPGERNDLSRANPTRVNALVAQLDAWAQENRVRLIAGADRDQPRGGGG